MGKDLFTDDILDTAKMWRALVFIAKSDMRARYKRSTLGPFWLVLSLGFGSVGLGLMWSVLWGANLSEMLPRIAVGFLIWNFVASSLIEGCGSFIQNPEPMLNVKLPISFFPMLTYSRCLVNFAHSFIIIITLSVIFPPNFSPAMLLVPVGITILIIDLYLLLYLLAFLATRFRDLQPLVSSIVPLLFFLSPVLFSLKQAKGLEWVMMLNPLTYLITIVRDPILGIVPSFQMYLGAVLIGVLTLIVLRYFVNLKHKQFIFWI